MKKNQIRGLAVVFIILAVFSAISFLPPFKMTETFWLSYIFGVISVLAQIYVLKTAFSGSNKAKSRFYGFPIARISVVYMGVQLILSILFMILAEIIPLWVSAIVFVILLAVAVVGFVAADTMRDEIVKQDTKLEISTSCMTALRSIVYPLAEQCDEEKWRKILQGLSDEFKYSDPVSSEVLKEIESELENMVAELQIAVSESRNSEILPLCKKISNTLAERNRLCKLNKGK